MLSINICDKQQLSCYTNVNINFYQDRKVIIVHLGQMHDKREPSVAISDYRPIYSLADVHNKKEIIFSDQISRKPTSVECRLSQSCNTWRFLTHLYYSSNFHFIQGWKLGAVPHQYVCHDDYPETTRQTWERRIQHSAPQWV